MVEEIPAKDQEKSVLLEPEERPGAKSPLPKANRTDLQLGRRTFHCITGVVAATLYNLFLTHTQIVYLLGACISIIYLFEQVRLHYPEISKRIPGINRAFLRAEEHLKESAMMPYAVGLLLTILTFPKPAAVIGIYTIALADPLCAIVGIQWGRHPLVKKKTWEGTLVFFLVTFLICFGVLWYFQGSIRFSTFGVSFFVGLFSASFELVPLRLDDNFTIPIYTALLTWIFCALGGIAL